MRITPVSALRRLADSLLALLKAGFILLAAALILDVTWEERALITFSQPGVVLSR